MRVVRGRELLTRDDESLVVPDHVRAEPIGAGRGADEYEQPARCDILGATGVPVGESESLEVAVALARHHLGSVPHRDVRRGCDPLQEVQRHRVQERRTPYHQHHMPGESRQGECDLARRVGGAYDIDIIALTLACFADVRAVVDPAAGQLLEPLRLQPSVRHASRHDERARLDLPGTIDEHGAHGPPCFESDDVTREDHLRAEARSLSQGALRQVRAAQSLGEPQVVLDRRAVSGLTPWCVALDDDGAQALGRSVDGGGQAGRSTADDAHVVQRLLRAGMQAECARKVKRGRRVERVAVRDEHEREVG